MKSSKINITVIGLGYVGLPLSLILSNSYKIIGYDINPNGVRNKIRNLESPELKKIYNKNYNKNFLISNKFQTSYVNFICASTNKKSLSVKNDSILSTKIIKNIIQKRKNFTKTFIVLMTTSEVGYSKKILNYLKKRKLDKKFEFLYTPERIFPSNLFYELVNNNRIIGNNKKKSFKFMKEIFDTFVKGEIIDIDHTSAELIKIFENTYRNVNIGLANELLKISLKEKLDIKNLLQAANQHPRVSILNPGIGIGGHCIPVDPKFLISKYNNIPLIKNSILSNVKHPLFITKKINNYIIKNNFKNILFLGLTYKPNVADFRNSPAIKIVKNTVKLKKSQIFICDPYLSNKIRNTTILENNQIYKYKFDLVLLLVAHKIFNINRIKKNEFIDLSGYRNYENINNL